MSKNTRNIPRGDSGPDKVKHRRNRMNTGRSDKNKMEQVERGGAAQVKEIHRKTLEAEEVGN